MIESKTATHEEFKATTKFTDEELDASAIQTAEQSRRITLKLLRILSEIERRHLYSKFKVSSLHGYCVERLKMDDGTAGRHVSASRLLREVPVIEEKIASGSMSLTSVSQAGVFFRKEAQSGNTFAPEEKRDLVMALENKSTREVDRILIANSAAPEIHFKEKVIAKSETMTELRLHIDEETLAAITRLKEIWSNANPHSNFADVIKRAALEAVEKHDPLKKIERGEKRIKTSPAAKQGAEFPDTTQAQERKAEIRRQIWKRDNCQCTHVDTATGELCGARTFLEEDHILPKAMGGEYSLKNIRLRCRAHNQRHAINSYGSKKMSQHLKSMKH